MYRLLDQKGQALLIVVLAMVVALTVGLSVASRSIVNLRNSQQDISSQQAISAAEAGIEQTIRNGASIARNNLSDTTSYSTTLTTVEGNSDFLLNGNNKVSKDDATYIWLSPYSLNPSSLFQNTWPGSSVNIYWGDSSTACNNAALEIVVLSGSKAVPITTKYVYDSCASRLAANHFTSSTLVSHPISNITLYNRASIPVTNGFLIRVTPLYSDAYVGASSSDPVNYPLPSQGSIITSTGTTDNNVKRVLNVFQGYPEIPAEFFPFGLFWP
jgi:hypothetical protein